MLQIHLLKNCPGSESHSSDCTSNHLSSKSA